METQNVTLAISKNLLHRVKLIAVKRRISLSRLLMEKLEEIATEEDVYETAKQQHLDLLKKGFNLGTNGNITWTREELHERR